MRQFGIGLSSSLSLVNELTVVMVGGIRHGFGWCTNPSAGGLQLSWTRNSLQAENFLKTLVNHMVGMDRWCPMVQRHL
jgi:hypothetical protein